MFLVVLNIFHNRCPMELSLVLVILQYRWAYLLIFNWRLYSFRWLMKILLSWSLVYSSYWHSYWIIFTIPIIFSAIINLFTSSHLINILLFLRYWHVYSRLHNLIIYLWLTLPLYNCFNIYLFTNWYWILLPKVNISLHAIHYIEYSLFNLFT